MRRYFVLLYLFSVGFSIGFSQSGPDTKTQAFFITRMTDKFHFSPQPTDDSLSAFVYHEIMRKLNEDQLYFLKEELELLAAYEFEIDDEIIGDDWRFVPQLIIIFEKSLHRSKKIIEKLAQDPIVFDKKEIYTPARYRGKIKYATEAELEKAVTLRFKFNVLRDLAEYGIDEDISDQKKLMKWEPEIRKKIRDDELETIDYFLNDKTADAIHSLFLNVLCSYYDPHSNYFSKNDKTDFDKELSSEDFRFGISLATNESDQVIIDQLEPGGAAWKSNKLNKGDRLLKLQWEGEKVTDVSEMNLDEVHTLLQREDKQILIFTVKKLNGSKKTVKLKKQKVEMKEELVKSYILTGEKKIGYIALPDFYTGWEGSSTHGCANDVAKEILKLQKENIEGIILDLRNNGGGSLAEALALVGIFVNEGPLAIIHLKGEKPVTMKDENRGTIFNGPLLIMVNGQSASASELLAASLQDHNRALIVGQQTYGKATGQIIIPVDTSLTWQKIALKDFGNASSFIKITTSKLYRINGKTAQKKGVVPDILLPDLYKGMYSREENYKRVLPSDTVIKKTYFTPLAELPEKKMNDALAERMNSDTLFSKKLPYRDSLVGYLDDSDQGIPLDLEEFMERLQKMEQLSEKLAARLESENNTYTVSNHSFEEQILSLDEYYRELNAEVMKEIAGDIQLMESFRILTDLINFTKK